jgi:hypothetical protein
MNASISSAVNAADLLALARLDDDGAPPAVSPPQPARRPAQPRDPRSPHGAVGRQPDGSDRPARSRQARRAAPTRLGAG